MNSNIRFKILPTIRKLLLKEEFSLRRGEGGEKIEISVIIPAFNQEEIIYEIIRNIVTHSSMNIEILVCDDHSTDSTNSIAKRVLEEMFINHTKIKHVKLNRSRIQLFEVLCDSLLIHQSEAPIVVDVQADISILEQNFDAKIWKIFEENPNLALLSGRGIDKISSVEPYLKSVGSEIALGRNLPLHLFFMIFILIGKRDLGKKINYKIETRRKSKAFQDNSTNLVKKDTAFDPYPKLSVFGSTGKAGRLGVLVDKEHDDFKIRENLYMGERFENVVMRGPLAIRRAAFDEVGGLDFLSFFQGFDDSDLAIRLHESQKWQLAYRPILFSAPLISGSMRKKKTRGDLISLTLHLLRIQFFRHRSSLFRFLQSRYQSVVKE